MDRRLIAEFTTPGGIAGKLRPFQESDWPGFLELLKDPEVMRFLLKQDSDDERREVFEKVTSPPSADGLGFSAIEIDQTFAGAVGLKAVNFEAPFTPCIEIGWRFHKAFWGKSIAYSAAECVLDYGFKQLELPEIVAFTTIDNIRSQRLMERLGFTRDFANDFDFPGMAADNPLLKHVLYRKTRA